MYMNVTVTYWESKYIEQQIEIEKKVLLAFLAEPTPFLTGTYNDCLISIKGEQINGITEDY